MTDLAEWVRTEQDILWDDLQDAVQSSINGTWSMHAANIARRIVEAARLVGPTPFGGIPWPLLAGGVYSAVLDAGRVVAPLPDEDEWERLDRMMSERHPTRRAIERLYAATVATINTDRERNWINGGDE